MGEVEITYPPDMLPCADDEEAEVIIIDPDTGKASVIAPPNPTSKEATTWDPSSRSAR